MESSSPSLDPDPSLSDKKELEESPTEDAATQNCSSTSTLSAAESASLRQTAHTSGAVSAAEAAAVTSDPPEPTNHKVQEVNPAAAPTNHQDPEVGHAGAPTNHKTPEAEPGAVPTNEMANCSLEDDQITYSNYESELQMPEIMRLIQKDLSEPYSIYTYRYFINNWPNLCFLVRGCQNISHMQQCY